MANRQDPQSRNESQDGPSEGRSQSRIELHLDSLRGLDDTREGRQELTLEADWQFKYWKLKRQHDADRKLLEMKTQQIELMKCDLAVKDEEIRVLKDKLSNVRESHEKANETVRFLT